MYNVIGRPDGTDVARHAEGGGTGRRNRHRRAPRAARTCSATLPPGQDALACHVKAYGRDGDVELVANILEGLAARDALSCPAQLLVRPADATVRAH